MTETDTIPPCGCPKLQLVFKHDCQKSSSGTNCKCLPTANTCAALLKMPTHFDSVNDMTQSFTNAIKHASKYGFGNA